jgi:acyl-CoA thioesterase
VNFSEILTGAAPRDGGFAVTVPEDWHQGRTAYGGFSSALALSAAMQVAEGLPPLRTAQLSMIAPLFGEVECRARVLRRGRNATWVSAEVSRANDMGGEVGLTATFAFMTPLDSVLNLDDLALPPGLIAVEDARPLPDPAGPMFLHNHFDLRFALPQREDRKPEFCWWVRARGEAALDPAVALLLVADALPPGVLALAPGGTPISTMQWQCNMLDPAPVTRDGWWLLRSTGDHCRAGGATQNMAVWNADGAPIMAGLQSVAIFG